MAAANTVEATLASRYVDGVSPGIAQTERIVRQQMGSIIAIAEIAASAFERLVGWMKSQVEEAARLAARIETLAVVNAQLARVNGYNEASIERLVGRIKALGITTQASRDIVNKMIAAQLDLSKATDLARLAQDAAVVAGQDSSTALQGIMTGIVTQQIEVLRTYGINIQFERAFAEARRRLGRDLTDLERRNTALNIVLSEGPKIAGAYEASLGTVGKQTASLQRYIEEAKASIGAQFLPEMRKLIETLTDLAKWVDRNSDALGLLAKAIAAAALGAAVAQFIGWMASAKLSVDALTLAMTRNPITAIAVGATVAGAAIYEMNQRTLRAMDDLVATSKAANDLKVINEAIASGKSIDDLKKMGYTLEQVREAILGGKDAAKEFQAAFDSDEFRKHLQNLLKKGADEEEVRKQRAAAAALAKEIAEKRLEAERSFAQAKLELVRSTLDAELRVYDEYFSAIKTINANIAATEGQKQEARLLAAKKFSRELLRVQNEVLDRALARARELEEPYRILAELLSQVASDVSKLPGPPVLQSTPANLGEDPGYRAIREAEIRRAEEFQRIQEAVRRSVDKSAPKYYRDLRDALDALNGISMNPFVGMLQLFRDNVVQIGQEITNAWSSFMADLVSGQENAGKKFLAAVVQIFAKEMLVLAMRHTHLAISAAASANFAAAAKHAAAAAAIGAGAGILSGLASGMAQTNQAGSAASFQQAVPRPTSGQQVQVIQVGAPGRSQSAGLTAAQPVPVKHEVVVRLEKGLVAREAAKDIRNNGPLRVAVLGASA